MKTLKKKIKILVEKTDTGFSAYSGEYPVYTTGKTISELHNNILEALNFYLEERNSKVRHNNIRLYFDLPKFFQYYKVLNAKYLSYRIGMNPTLLSQYVNGHKKPSQKQTRKILNGVNEIGKELSEINLINP